MIPLFLDIETYSPLSLKTYGTHRYAEEAEILMTQYAIGDGEVIVEDTLTPRLSALLTDPQYDIVIHNSHFDRTLIRHCTGIELPVERIFDTMVCAMTHSLPGALDKLCDILGINKDKAKDKEGSKWINMFCVPQTDRKTKNVYRNTKETHPEEWEKFRNYGRLDIEAMREVYKLLPRWNYKGFEKELWELDQRINDRGFKVDLELANAAIKASKVSKDKHNADTLEKTNGSVKSANQRQAMLDFFKSQYNLSIDDLRSSTVRDLLRTSLPKEVIDLLEIRLDVSKTPDAKYKRAVNCVNKDGRLRGTLQFSGAGRTKRWAGRVFQPHNLPRATVSGEALSKGIEALKAGKVSSSDYTVLELCSSALRGVIICEKSNKLAVADLSNIEGRVLAWMAEENWKVKAFKDFDSGKGHDLYNLTYAKAFGVKVEDVTDDMRQIGKVMELAFGYQGGIGAWITFATAYGIDLEDMADKAYGGIPTDTLRQAENFLKWYKEQGKTTYGLSEKAFVTCDSFKRLWRDEHTNIVNYWKEIETASINATNSPGKTYIVGKHKIRRDGAWLRIGLPSGGCLCYSQPELKEGKLSYAGINQYTRKWDRIKTYGGKLVENIVQAVARDILAYGMVNAEKMNYSIVLTVHDEIIAEVPDNENFSAKGLSSIMSKAPIWAIDLPLAAKGFDTHRYRK